MTARDNLEDTINIEKELDSLETIIFESFHLPLTKLTIINEQQVLRQLDLIRNNLPVAIEQALEVLARKKEIISSAEDYADQVLESAKKRAMQIRNESGIIQQAELEARQIRQKVQEDCDNLQARTLADLERMRLNAQAQLEQMEQMAIQESETIKKDADAYIEAVQRDADSYVDYVFGDLEHRLEEMLKVIQNGRRQVKPPV